jgi:hypothetical protein
MVAEAVTVMTSPAKRAAPDVNVKEMVVGATPVVWIPVSAAEPPVMAGATV